MSCNSSQGEASVNGTNDEDSTISNETKTEFEEPTEYELSKISSFYCDWHVAAYRDDAWWHIRGCPDYNVYIENVGREGEFGRITLGDRMGMAVWLKAAIKQIDIEKNGKFEFKCVDEYSANREFILSGKITDFNDKWEAKIVELDKGYFTERLIEEIGVESEIDSINLFLSQGVIKFPIKEDAIEGCP